MLQLIADRDRKAMLGGVSGGEGEGEGEVQAQQHQQGSSNSVSSERGSPRDQSETTHHREMRSTRGRGGGSKTAAGKPAVKGAVTRRSGSLKRFEELDSDGCEFHSLSDSDDDDEVVVVAAERGSGASMPRTCTKRQSQKDDAAVNTRCSRGCVSKPSDLDVNEMNARVSLQYGRSARALARLLAANHSRAYVLHCMQQPYSSDASSSEEEEDSEEEEEDTDEESEEGESEEEESEEEESKKENRGEKEELGVDFLLDDLDLQQNELLLEQRQLLLQRQRQLLRHQRVQRRRNKRGRSGGVGHAERLRNNAHRDRLESFFKIPTKHCQVKSKRLVLLPPSVTSSYSIHPLFLLVPRIGVALQTSLVLRNTLLIL